MPEFTRASALSGLRETIMELGGRPDSLARQCGVDFGLIRNQDALISLRSLQQLASLGAHELDRSDFGLIWGQRTDLALLGPLFVGMVNAKTVGAGLDLASRYLHLHTRPLHLSVVRLPGQSRSKIMLANAMKRPAKLVVTMERNLVILHRLVGQMAGSDYQPLSLLFGHSQQGPLSVYRSIFGVVPKFDEKVYAVGIRSSLLSQAIAPRSDQMFSMAKDYLANLGPARNLTFSNRIEGVISMMLKQDCLAEGPVAKFLGLSTRALQRHLRAEGTTFTEMRQHVRRSLAERHLNDQRMSLTQIAQELGYSDQASFSRSCRKWFGASPSSVRKALSS